MEKQSPEKFNVNGESMVKQTIEELLRTSSGRVKPRELIHVGFRRCLNSWFLRSTNGGIGFFGLVCCQDPSHVLNAVVLAWQWKPKFNPPRLIPA